MPESRRAFMLATARSAGVTGPILGLLAGTDALLIDVRRNRGGSPGTVALIQET